MAAAAHAKAAHVNGLDPTAFPSIAAMEGDLIATAAGLLGGDDATVGLVTSGGTESCLLAVVAARDARPDIEHPRMVLPATVHAAFHKAAHYFGVITDVIDVDPDTFRVDPVKMAAAIGPDTVLVVASAPSYAHGVIDPITQIAAAAQTAQVRCHVDACIGGWVLGSWNRMGKNVTPFDLRVPGVTSISVDLHKYAYAPKGTSILLHRDNAHRATGFFAFTDWPGYTMLNTTTQSTRSGGPVAAAWAVVAKLGWAGYADLATKVEQACQRIRDGVTQIPGLRILGDPAATLIAVAGSDPAVDVFQVADEMAVRGYYVQPQFAHRNSPANLHLTITAANHGHETELIDALAAAVNESRSMPAEPIEQLLTAAQTTEFGALAGSLGLLDAGGNLQLPSRMAPLNGLLNALAPPIREQILRQVLGALNQPRTDLLQQPRRIS